jgi:FAD/FMN-containing dehydrogenase
MATNDKTSDPINVSDDLRTQFDGQLLAPGDDGYDTARRIHNGLIDKRPGLIARCTTAADVQAAIRVGRDTGAEIAVRGGGHNVAGRAVTEGGVMIDLAPMRRIEVDPTARTVRAGAGVTWGELDDELGAHGLATTGGQVSTTGIAGLTLGGGLGYLLGKHGLAVDNLVSAEVVTADGSALTASAEENPDLFWAIRGGGGNFGVVTSFEYQAHRLPQVVGGIVAYPFASARGTLDTFRAFTVEPHDDIGVACGLVHAPDGSGEKIVALPLCHAGDGGDRAVNDLKALRESSTPVLDTVGPMPYAGVNKMLDGAFPAGALSYWKSAFLADLDDDVMAVLIDAYERVPSPMSALIVEQIHGAACRVPVDATAFPHRERGWQVLIIAQWASADDTQANIAWARSTFSSLRPHLVERRYVNYLSADDAGAVREAYGPNYERLVAAKRRFDPDNTFRLNQNIPPLPVS